MNVTLGVFWLISGVVWLRRGIRDEVHPNAPTTLFAQPQIQSDNDRRWNIGLGVFNVILGGLYVLFAMFHH